MADAYVKLGLNPSGVVAGAQQAAAGLTPFIRRAQTIPAALRPVTGSVDALTRSWGRLHRAARGAVDQQVAGARRAAAAVQAVGRSAGAGFGSSVAAGIRAGQGAVVAATARTAAAVDAYLPQGGRNASRGPLANLTRSGRSIPEALAAGVRAGEGRLRSTVASMARAAEAPLRGIGAGVTTLGATRRGAGGFVTTPTDLRRGVGFVFRDAGPDAAGRLAPPAGGATAQRTWGTSAGGIRGPGFVVMDATETRRMGGAWADAAQRAGGGRAPGGGAVPPSGGAAPAPAGTRAPPVGAGTGPGTGFHRLFLLGAAAGQVQHLGRALNRASQSTVEAASNYQTAAAEIRTVEPTAAGRDMLIGAARAHALGQTEASRIAGVGEAEFLQAAFAARASGFTARQAAAMVPQAALLGIAGQIDPKAAQIAIGDAMSVFTKRTAPEVADMFARAQDIGVFPRGAGEMFNAFTKMASTAEAAGMNMADTLGVVVGLSGLGQTFRGATGGQKGLMAIREMEMGAMEDLGLRTIRTAAGGLDFAANITALRELNPSVEAVNEAFGKRAAPAILGLIGRVDTLNAGLGDFTGTAMENAREHADSYSNSMKRASAMADVFQADMGEGGVAVRKFGAEVGTVALGTLGGLLNEQGRKTVGGALAVGGAVTGVTGGVLEAMVGINAFRELLPGMGKMFTGLGKGLAFPIRMGFRLGSALAGLAGQGLMTAGRLAASSNAVRGMFRTLNAGITAGRRGFLGMFGFLGRAFPLASGLLQPLSAGLTKLGPALLGIAPHVAVIGGLAFGLVKLGDAFARRHGEKTLGEQLADITAVGLGTWIKENNDRIRDSIVPPDEAVAAGWKPAYPGDVPTAADLATTTGATTTSDAGATPAAATTPEVAATPAAPVQTVPPKPEPTPGPPLLLPGATPATMTGTAPAPAADVLPAGTAGGVQLWVPSWTGASPLAVGAQAGQDALVNQTADTAQRVRDFYPSSDAKVGPLSDLTAAGMAIPGTIAAGMAVGSPMLLDATTTMLGAARALLPAGSPEMGLGGHLLPAGTGGLPPVPAPAPGEGAEPIADSAGAPVLADALRILAERTAENTRALARIERALTDPRGGSSKATPARDRSLDIYRRVSGIAPAESE